VTTVRKTNWESMKLKGKHWKGITKIQKNFSIELNKIHTSRRSLPSLPHFLLETKTSSWHTSTLSNVEIKLGSGKKWQVAPTLYDPIYMPKQKAK
jgi:hypothetical protein